MSASAVESPGRLIYLILPLSLLPAAALLALSFLNDYQNWGDDWALYVLQAKAVLNHDVAGIVQQNIFMARESTGWHDEPVAYPWGLPLLLALEGSLFSFDLHTFKLFNILIFLFLALAVFQLARRFLPVAVAFATACMFGFNPVLLHYCNHILTEIPFTLASVCAFIAMEYREPRGRARAPRQLMTGALAFIAFTLRANGVLILAAATAREFLPSPDGKGWRRPPLRELPLPYISFGLLYAVWSAVFPGTGSGEMLRYVTLDSIIHNALSYLVSLFDVFTGGHWSAGLAIVLGPLILLGAVTSRSRTAHLSLYALLTLGLYSLWPFYQSRYMIPLAPFLVILMMLGLDVLSRRTSAISAVSMLVRSVQYGIPLAFLIAALVLVGTGRLPQEKWNPYDRSSSEMFRWVRENTPSDAVMSFFKPRAMLLLGERVSLTATTSDIRKASYFVYAGDLPWNEGQPSLQEYQQAAELTRVFANQNFVIYRIEKKS